MSVIQTAEDIIPVSEFKSQIAEWLRKVAVTGLPVVVTQNGRAAGIVLSPAAYDALTEQARFVTAVQAGLADLDAGRVQRSEDVLARARSRHSQPTASSKLTVKAKTTIPQAVRLALQIEPGDTIAYQVNPNGSVTLTKAQAVAEQDSAVIFPEWASPEDEAAFRNL